LHHHQPSFKWSNYGKWDEQGMSEMKKNAYLLLVRKLEWKRPLTILGTDGKILPLT
jgi:hypothetical protein